MAKQLKAAILARRAAKARKKRTRPKPRQYTIADLKRARDQVAAAERRIALLAVIYLIDIISPPIC